MIELVNNAIGERLNLLYVGDFQIDLGGVSPEVYAEFKAVERQRQLLREHINRGLGLPADAILKMLGDVQT
jgi:hypothetical protein